MSTDQAFAALQARLKPLDAPHDLRQSAPRTIIGIPSINVTGTLLARHGAQLPALEERGLWLLFALRRPFVKVVMVTAVPVDRPTVEHLLSLMPDVPDARERLEFVTPDDDSHRPLAAKLLDRPDLLADLRDRAGGPDNAFIFPFNVKREEREVALAIDAPIYGIDDRFFTYGTKSGGRRLFAEQGVLHPRGAEDVRTLDDLRREILALRRAQPNLAAVVAKLDESVYGEGNQVLALNDLPPVGTAAEQAALDVRLRALPLDWLDELRDGGIVEEMIEGEEIRSPSVQMRVLPGGHPRLVSTHDQVLGGPLGQTFVGCRFPADPTYAALIVAEARKVGAGLAAAGVVGRFGVDFVVSRRADGSWRVAAVEINLREGGTSHPYASLWLLSDGKISADGSEFWTAEEHRRWYFATDHVEARHYRGLDAAHVCEAARAAGVLYDAATHTGIVLHMLRSLPREGRCAAVAIGESPADAHERYLALVDLLDGLSAGTRPAPRSA